VAPFHQTTWNAAQHLVCSKQICDPLEMSSWLTAGPWP